MQDRWVRYNPRLKQIARVLRNNMTLGEILLWKELKGKKLLGYDFHRQKPIDRYVVDFYCPRLKLVIEIDGDSHEGKEEADRIRQEKLESLGLTVLRFWDSDVKCNVDGIVGQLQEWIEARGTHPKIPSPLSSSQLRGDFFNSKWKKTESKYSLCKGKLVSFNPETMVRRSLSLI